jgi:hypothetical protein
VLFNVRSHAQPQRQSYFVQKAATQQHALLEHCTQRGPEHAFRSTKCDGQAGPNRLHTYMFAVLSPLEHLCPSLQRLSPPHHMRLPRTTRRVLMPLQAKSRKQAYTLEILNFTFSCPLQARLNLDVSPSPCAWEAGSNHSSTAGQKSLSSQFPTNCKGELFSPMVQ